MHRPLMEPEVPSLDFVLYTYSKLTMLLMVPVSVTIFLVVWGVQNLTPYAADRNQAPLYLAADESGASSSGQRAEAATYNALLIVGMILGITFIMVLLYKCNCIKVIIVWFVGSALLIFWLLSWIWCDLVCTKYQIPYDYLGMAFFLWNFGTVGCISLFYYGPAKMMQAYLVFLSMIMGWMLARLPEWSTWAILLGIATYDICAVLLPYGPLKMLVSEAQKRKEPIPGFVYDSGDGALVTTRRRKRPQPPAPEPASHTPRESGSASPPPPGGASPAAASGAEEMRKTNPIDESAPRGTTPAVNDADDRPEDAAEPSTAAAGSGDDKPLTDGDGAKAKKGDDDKSKAAAKPDEEEEEDDDVPPDPFVIADMANPFRLGLGDFIFYSLLVGRAAMFSYVSWMTCYICVINGLVGTLICLLFLRGRVPALPALPFSVYIGVSAYFVTRYSTVPYNYYIGVSGLTI